MATNVRLRATYHYGNYRNVKVHTLPDDSPASMADALRRGYVGPPHVTETMGATMGRHLAETGRYELGWMTWEVVD